MQTKHLLLALALTIGLLAAPSNVEAKIIINNDIVMDTVWTPDMNPIILEARTNKNGARNVTSSTIRVGNGATLTIEPGVIIMAGRDVNFRVTTQCMQGFNTGECILDAAGKIKRPNLIAKGTKENPIVFTSTTDIAGKTPKAGDWGTFTINRRGATLEWIEFRYGGGGDRTRLAFLEALNLTLRNSIIAHSAKPALRTERGTLIGNVITDSSGTAIYCKEKCTIRQNYIAGHAGDAIELDTTGETTVTGNFFYQNAGAAITSDIRRDILTTISQNYFLENKGGIYFLYGGPRQKINGNNFLRNTDFAIKADNNVSNTGKTVKILDNWFGIDSGATQTLGPYFVSPVYDAGTYATDGHDFALLPGTPAAEAYAKYRGETAEDTALFQITVERRALIGDDRTPGSLQLYTVELDNRTIKAVRNATLVVSLPTDQELLLCSLLHDETAGELDYVFGTVCPEALPTSTNYAKNQLYWQPKSIAALSSQKLYFVTALKVNAKGVASLPRLTLKRAEDKRARPFAYTLDSTATIQQSGSTQSTPAVAAQPSESSNITTTPTAPVNTDGVLATGTVFRQVISGVLQYVLKADDGKYYVLYNSAKWREIDDFTKGAKRGRTISVWGSWYVNRYGVTTGIKFTEFEVQ